MYYSIIDFEFDVIRLFLMQVRKTCWFWEWSVLACTVELQHSAVDAKPRNNERKVALIMSSVVIPSAKMHFCEYLGVLLLVFFLLLFNELYIVFIMISTDFFLQIK